MSGRVGIIGRAVKHRRPDPLEATAAYGKKPLVATSTCSPCTHEVQIDAQPSARVPRAESPSHTAGNGGPTQGGSLQVSGRIAGVCRVAPHLFRREPDS